MCEVRIVCNLVCGVSELSHGKEKHFKGWALWTVPNKKKNLEAFCTFPLAPESFSDASSSLPNKHML